MTAMLDQQQDQFEDRPVSPSSSVNTHTSASTSHLSLRHGRGYDDVDAPTLSLPSPLQDHDVGRRGEEEDEDGLITPPSTAPPSLWSACSHSKSRAAAKMASTQFRSVASRAARPSNTNDEATSIVEKQHHHQLDGQLIGSAEEQELDEDDGEGDRDGDEEGDGEEGEEDLGVDLPATLSHAHSILLAEARALLDAASRLQQQIPSEEERIAGPSSSPSSSTSAGRHQRSGAATSRSSFEGAIKVLVRTIAGGGKIVWTGVGKSGLIARKLCATSMSLGLPSVYMHPTEALHGDLGLVSGHFPHAPVAPLLRARASENRAPPPPRQPDAICALSHSGGSSELLQLLPHLTLRGCPILAFSAREDSQLVEAATSGGGAWVDCRTSSSPSSSSSTQEEMAATLTTDGTAEADALVPAPTSSTTVALAMGDALVLSVARACGLGKQSFTRNHPGGKLGGKLLQEETLIRMGSAAA